MSSKNEILNKLKQYAGEYYEMPNIDAIDAVVYPDKIEKFVEVSKSVGGDAIVLKSEESLDEVIKKLYPEAKSIASILPEITIATFNPDEIDDPHLLNGTDLAVVRGEIGVAENACVWIPQQERFKALYFVSEYLVIVLDKEKIVSNMHEAYRQIHFTDKGFGVFVSGPSKTADIEQALVIGAHGPKGVTVIIK